jgi:energy-coupling factor transporter ATP-binding protein EcfA2
MNRKSFDMEEYETICPYTGLRSFTEEESLYFKGREAHIHAVTALLEEKKFLMLTGASGDGKSSLIFAGLIPQARAGFFKAQYSNWYIADFRPERSPLQNLAASLTSALQIEDRHTVEVELSRGFSSLAELYKSSDRYIDEKSEAWKTASDEGKSNMERRAGNLLILIDQFEEFFTNPENFPGGVPSQESRLLLNIVLETIKISLKENLPIYVVCTMRSDYIGECAAFRGLPEFIGFSQFFVPRLQRKELHQVIEEPAILSGNRISNRLVDRLIFDLEEGADQLPILQHALKQIWKAANNGREEMDLLHYAMVGGMSGDRLPKEMIDRFNAWKNTLPEYEQTYLKNPGLSNVLDIHANKIYEEAAAYYNRDAQNPITPKQAKFIIGLSFACLTRIDESRAVRNRMTLQEITNIINVPALTTDVVGRVLRIFRSSENTLLRPFIIDGDANQSVHPDTVIDITHEALIRNWKLLRKWADQEYAYYITFLDFKKQVDRWISHGKSEDFLLPIGPLPYFENWYKNCRPNQYWINRYNNEDADPEVKLNKSAAVLKNCRDYLRKSALRLLVTRTFMRYGAKRIGLVAGLVALVFLGAYLVYQWRIQTNEYVLDKIVSEADVLLADKEPDFFAQSFFTVDADRMKPGLFNSLMHKLPAQRKIDVAINVIYAIAWQDQKSNPPILLRSLVCADSLIQNEGSRLDTLHTPAVTAYLNNLNDLVRNQSFYLFLRPDANIENLQHKNTIAQANLVYHTIMRTSKLTDMKALHIAATDALNNKAFTPTEIQSLIDSISPLERNHHASHRFNVLFPKEEKITAGAVQNFSHNGGYHLLAYLYAAVGNVNRTLQCLDSLRHFKTDYDKQFTNSRQAGAYFLLYQHAPAFREFAERYSAKLGIPRHVYVIELLSSAGIRYVDHFLKFIKRGNVNDNLRFLDGTSRKQLFDFAGEFIRTELKTPDDVNFNLALLYKLYGALNDKIESQQELRKSTGVDSLFRISLSYYDKVSRDFLEEHISADVQTVFLNSEKRILPRKHLYLFPDHLKTVESNYQPTWFRFYGSSFFRFMLKNNLFSAKYRDSEDYQLLVSWVRVYLELYRQQGNAGFLLYPQLDRATFLSLDSLIGASHFDLDAAEIKLMLIRDYFKAGDTVKAYQQIRALEFKEFERPGGGGDRSAFHNLKIIVAGQLAVQGKRKESLAIISRFSNPKNRIKSYAKMALFCQRKQLFTEAKFYLDSANSELRRLKNFTGDFRMPLIEVLTLQNDRKSEKKALEYVGSMAWFDRAAGVATMVWGYATLDKYYKALGVIPPLSSAFDRLLFYDNIIEVENLKPEHHADEWKRHDDMVSESINYTYFENDLIDN